MLPTMTMQSKRLKADEKYTLIPRAYILKHISHTKRPRKTNSAMSARARKNVSQQGLRDPNLVGGGLQRKSVRKGGWPLCSTATQAVLRKTSRMTNQ